MPYFYYYYDPMYFVVLLAVLLSWAASARVHSTYNKYAKVRNASGVTGREAAERILRSQGILDVTVGRTEGTLSDHYDSRTKTLSLSDGVYQSSSLSAVSIAAHECGHAIQHAKGYVPLNLRIALVPVANFGSRISIPLIIIGFLFTGSTSDFLIQMGIILFSAAVLFQLVTLPVEFDASRRAMGLVQETGILTQDELSGSRKVLSAAALTYVAAAAVSVTQLLRLLSLFGGGRRRD